MKLRYKKIILLVLISTMGIGVLTLSISPNHNVKESMKYSDKQKDKSSDLVTEAATDTPTIVAQIVTPTPAVITSPTPYPVYDLETEGYSDIKKLMKNYYKAKLECDTTKLKTLVSDPENIPSEKALKDDVQFYEEYRNLECYVKKGFAEGTYIVFTYYDIKITNIKTLAPALTENYVITEDDGSLKIVFGELDDQIKTYYKDRVKDADVKKLRTKTDKKLKKALKKDKTFKIFYNNLQKINSKKKSSKD